MYASRMFHSSGTVQSRICVPLGTSWLERDPLPDRGQRSSDPVAGDATADREERGRAPASGPCTRGRNGDRRHEAILACDEVRYERSRSLTTAITPGHAISNAGSSKRTPRAASGAWNSDIW